VPRARNALWIANIHANGVSHSYSYCDIHADTYCDRDGNADVHAYRYGYDNIQCYTNGYSYSYN
jgi:hypothetical protein